MPDSVQSRSREKSGQSIVWGSSSRSSERIATAVSFRGCSYKKYYRDTLGDERYTWHKLPRTWGVSKAVNLDESCLNYFEIFSKEVFSRSSWKSYLFMGKRFIAVKFLQPQSNYHRENHEVHISEQSLMKVFFDDTLCVWPDCKLLILHRGIAAHWRTCLSFLRNAQRWVL